MEDWKKEIKEWDQIEELLQRFKEKGWDVCVFAPEAEASVLLMAGARVVEMERLREVLEEIYETYKGEVLMLFVPFSKTWAGVLVVERRTGLPLRAVWRGNVELVKACSRALSEEEVWKIYGGDGNG